MLNTGDTAPPFEVKDTQNNTVTLDQFKGKIVVLYFYPKDDTPGCTIEAQDFSSLKPQFEESNTHILGVSKDLPSSHEKFCNKYNLNIQLLSDPDMELINAYGVWREKNMYGKKSMGLVRSTFLIDESGKISHIWNHVKAKGHAEKVLSHIVSLKTKV